MLKKKWFWGAVLGLVIVVLVLGNIVNANKAAIVKTANVTEGSMTEQIYTNGQLEPEKTTEIYAPASGVADTVKVKLGDPVTKGQTLLTLGMDDIKDQLDKERINLQLSEAERLAAKKQHFDNFKKSQVENPDQVIKELDLSSYDLRIRSSQLTIASLEKKLSKQKVQAEVDGVVTQVSINPGQMIAEGSGMITVADLSTYKVTANLNELDAGKVALGMKAVISGESFVGTYDGEVTYLAPTAELADPQSKDASVEMTVSVKKPSPVLRAGYNVTIEMEIPDKKRLIVPIEAVQYEGDQKFVFKVVDGKAVRVTVKTGKENEELIEIVSGVANGQAIVAEGADKLRDGDKVKTQ